MDNQERVLAITNKVADISIAEFQRNSSDYEHAFNWTVFRDDMFLCPDSENLIQRYVLSLFYFATGGDKWDYCSRRKGKTECPGRNRFLSRHHECTWAGIACSGTTVTRIEFGEFEKGTMQCFDIFHFYHSLNLVKLVNARHTLVPMNPYLICKLP